MCALPLVLLNKLETQLFILKKKEIENQAQKTWDSAEPESTEWVGSGGNSYVADHMVELGTN